MNNTRINSVNNFFAKYVKQLYALEKISFLILFIGLVGFYFKIPQLHPVFEIGAGLLALIYYILSFTIDKFEKRESPGMFSSLQFRLFLNKIYYYGLAASNFALIIRHGREPLIIIGGTSLLIVLILVLVSKIKDKSNIYDFTFLIRLVIYLLILVYFFIAGHPGLIN